MIKLCMRVCFLVIVGLVGFAGPAQAEARVESNVIYGMYSGLALLMDVYHPERPNGFGIVVIPGSGWHMPMDLDVAPLKAAFSRPIFRSDALLAAGYTLFVIDHRAAPRFRYPAAVEDAQRAVRLVRYNANSYGIDPGSIGALGGSSGGHLVSMLGVLDGAGDPEDASQIDRASAKVQAVVAIFPPTDFLAFVRGSGGDKATVGSFLGTNLGRNDKAAERRYEAASPISHVSADDPPFLLIHGDADPVVPVEQSKLFREALAKAGVHVELKIVPGGGHGGTILDGANAADALDGIVGWFDANLRHESGRSGGNKTGNR
jgi:acetyl esterase/lipase